MKFKDFAVHESNKKDVVVQERNVSVYSLLVKEYVDETLSKKVKQEK